MIGAGGLTFEAVMAVIRRYAVWFGAVVLGCILIAAIFTLVQTPRFEAASRVIIEPRTQTVLPTEDVMSGLPQRDVNVVDTEVEALYSVELAKRVVRDLDLMNDPEFQRLVDGKPDLERTANAVIGNLSVRRAGETYLIDIVTESVDAKKAAKLADSYAINYIALQKATKRAATQQANDLLAERIDEMAAEVEEAERQVQQYRIANGLMSVNGATLAEQSIAEIDNELARARASEREALGRLASARSSGVRVDAAQTPALQTLRASLASAEQDLREAQQTYGPQHPRYQTSQARVDELRKAVAAETDRARAALSAERQQEIDRLTAEAAAAAQRRASLSGSVGGTRGALASTNKAQVQLNKLMRDAQAVRATYEAYLNRYQETTTKLGTEQADARIVSQATIPPSPTKPSLKMNLALGGLMGVALALAAIVGFATLDSKLNTPAEIERMFDVDSLPSLPTLESTLERDENVAEAGEPEDYILEHPQSIFAEQYRNLRAALLRSKTDERIRVVAMTSSLPNEGKTTSSICLARLAAVSDIRTIIVDCDLRHRSLNRLVPDNPDKGLVEFLKGDATLEQVIWHDEASGMDILPISTARHSKSDYIGSEKMRQLIADLRERYEFVVLDTPPVLPLADTRLIAGWADAVAVMCRWRSTPRRALESTLEILADADAKIAGVGLSMVDLRKQSRQGYGDPTFYYSKYKSYYTKDTLA